MYYYDDYVLEEDKMGMMVTSGSVILKKDGQNLVGISIGGGAPLCPCLYIVQVFDGTPAAKEGTLQSGDEVVGVNGQNVKGRTKVEVAKLIQSFPGEVTILYNKLHVDPKDGKSLDISLKKFKHRIVENMSSTTADILGFSRAILVNDSMVRRLQELEGTSCFYEGLVDRVRKYLRAHYAVAETHHELGDVFAEIGCKELQPAAAEAFTKFAESHRQLERGGAEFVRKASAVVGDFNTFLVRAIPDMRLTVNKYLDAKFEYLSFCLKVKEMDDEEAAYVALGEPLYRVETGNYEYRLVLRCRQLARSRFAALRQDVLVKLELLDQKHVQDLVLNMKRLMEEISNYATQCEHTIADTRGLFPIEIDLSRQTFTLDRRHVAEGAQPPPEPEPEQAGGEDEEAPDDVPEQYTTAAASSIAAAAAAGSAAASASSGSSAGASQPQSTNDLISID